jgi:hypothetical protein
MFISTLSHPARRDHRSYRNAAPMAMQRPSQGRRVEARKKADDDKGVSDEKRGFLRLSLP